MNNALSAVRLLPDGGRWGGYCKSGSINDAEITNCIRYVKVLTNPEVKKLIYLSYPNSLSK